MEKKTRNRGKCKELHNEIVKFSKELEFRDLHKRLGIPANTLRDYCKRENIEVILSKDKMSDHAEDIVRLATVGLNTLQISKELGLDPNSIRYFVKTNQIKVKNGNDIYDDQELQNKVIQMRKECKTHKQISEELGIPMKRIPSYLKHNSVEDIGSVEAKVVREKINIKAFSEVDEYSVYWLGWIITDGNITDNHSVALSLKGDDWEIVEAFKEYLKPSAKIYQFSTFHKQTQKIVTTASFSIRNKDIADNLRKQNVEERKSCKEKLPNFDWLHSEFAPVFWRAVVEGDGHLRKDVKKPGLELVGSEELLNGFIKFCEVICGVKVGKKLEKRNYGNPDFRLLRYHCSDAIKIIKVLWSKGSIFLKRKQETAMTVLKYDEEHRQCKK